ncbi:MAG: MauE/DoxX family redox-associated membrane protein [Deltaproteobacteria bacterium]
MRRLALAARIALAGLFLWAAGTKVPDMAAYAESVANYRIVPAVLVPTIAALLVGVESVAALALLVRPWARSAALLLALLLAVFTIGLTSALARGIDLACGCFGGSDQATWWTVLRDLVLLALALGVAASSPPSPARPARREPDPAAAP